MSAKRKKEMPDRDLLPAYRAGMHFAIKMQSDPSGLIQAAGEDNPGGSMERVIRYAGERLLEILNEACVQYIEAHRDSDKKARRIRYAKDAVVRAAKRQVAARADFVANQCSWDHWIDRVNAEEKTLASLKRVKDGGKR